MEIASGIPLWLSLKAKVTNSHVIQYGLYGFSGRDISKIVEKQVSMVRNLKGGLKKYESFYRYNFEDP